MQEDGEVEVNLAYVIRACLQRDKSKHQPFCIRYTINLCVCMFLFILKAQNFQAICTISILCNLLTPSRESRIPVITQTSQNIQGYHSSEFIPTVTLLPGNASKTIKYLNVMRGKSYARGDIYC